MSTSGIPRQVSDLLNILDSGRPDECPGKPASASRRVLRDADVEPAYGLAETGRHAAERTRESGLALRRHAGFIVGIELFRE